MNKILTIVTNRNLDGLLSYSLSLAHQLKAQLWIQYIYDIPSGLTGRVHLHKDTLSAHEEVVHRSLMNQLKQLYPSERTTIKLVVNVGNLVYKMNHLIDEEKIDLVVVDRGDKKGNGMDTTLEVINHAHCAVLAITDGTRFIPFQHLVLATDLKQIPIKEVDGLSQFIKTFQAHLDIIHVSTSNELSSKWEIFLESSLASVPLQFYHILSQDIEESIEKHVIEHQNDLLVLIRRDHSIVEKLFHKSISHKIVKHLHVPILMLHETYS